MLLRQHIFCLRPDTGSGVSEYRRTVINHMYSYESLRKLHPCLGRGNEGGGRLHLPVSPSCNLCCRYCSRMFTASEERPGRTRGILPLHNVGEVIKKALELCPELTTVGIAGPGEALATDHAVRAFEITDREFPELIKCLSTNGLMLEEKAPELAEVHVDTVTVTVNAVDPSVQEKINKRIYLKGRWVYGEEAARILIDRQLRGIEKASALGMTVKVNTVLIPGINDSHIGETARKTAEAGARICNIIPLIPQAEMSDLDAPGCEELADARAEAEPYLDVFRHCRHCRADAAGKLNGEDYGKILYGGPELGQETFSHG